MGRIKSANSVVAHLNSDEHVDDAAKLHSKRLPIDDVRGILSWWSIFYIYMGYSMMLLTGWLQSVHDRLVGRFGAELAARAPPGYAPLTSDVDYFWLHFFYQRLRDCFERPICSVPGASFDIKERYSDNGNATFKFTGRTINSVNLGSYNYLGFGQNSGPVIDEVCKSIDRYSYACGTARNEGGNYQVMQDLEHSIAKFVGKPAAMIIGMGFATNSTTLPIICGGKGTLIISDTLNHNSIVTGSRDSSARIVTFRHNDPVDLERVLRRSIVDGQPRTRRPWKKIFIIVEGIYSMEGEMPHLREIVALKKKYKAYLYVDEAHSIGALGAHGRGVCEQTGVDPADVDVLMGTFTKAFGSVGGYVAGSPEFIEMLRHKAYGTTYATAFSPPCAQQALSALRVISGEDGTNDGQERIRRLHENSNYFRKRMEEEGFHMFGDYYSPVVLLMTYHPAVMTLLSRALLERGLAIVIVGFPVTPLLLSRIRFCISASHTIEQLEEAVQAISKYGDAIKIKYAKDANYWTYTQYKKNQD